MKRCSVLAMFLLTSTLLTYANDVVLPPNGDGFGTIPDEQPPQLTAAVVVSKPESGKTLGAQTLTATKADQSVLLVTDGATARAQKTTFEKSAGNVTNGGQSNFYGLNAAVVAQDGSALALQDVTVTTNAEGANAVFSTGEGSSVTIKNITIRTKANSSRGLDATYGGVITADKVNVETLGAHCAAFATDRGEGTVTVNAGTARTAGEGSPLIYSTGNITVRNLTGTATGAEIAVIEGKNSITLTKATLTGGITHGHSNEVHAAVMLYQSMSGDANQGTSLFTATDSTLTSTASGAFFYVTNTNAALQLTRTKLINPTDVLLQASGNESERGWGRKGANGGTVTLTATNQVLTGNVVVDAISSVTLVLNNGAKFTGAINAANSGAVKLTLAKKATLTLTADSYCNELDVEDVSFKNIKTGGHTLFYNKKLAANSYLHGRTILLADGGKLVGIELDYAEATLTAAGKASEDSQPQPPFGNSNLKLLTISGRVSVSGDTVTVTTADDAATVYTLTVLKAPDGEASNQRMGNQPPAPPSGDKGAMPRRPPQGKPPRDGMSGNSDGAPNSKNGEAPLEHQLRKHVTLADLKALDGKTVEIRGFIMQDRKLAVLQLAEK
mgnify:CR=1 FL=1